MQRQPTIPESRSRTLLPDGSRHVEWRRRSGLRSGNRGWNGNVGHVWRRRYFLTGATNLTVHARVPARTIQHAGRRHQHGLQEDLRGPISGHGRAGPLSAQPHDGVVPRKFDSQPAWTRPRGMRKRPEWRPVLYATQVCKIMLNGARASRTATGILVPAVWFFGSNIEKVARRPRDILAASGGSARAFLPPAPVGQGTMPGFTSNATCN